MSIKNLLVKFKKLHQDAVIPTRAHATDAGLDLYALHDVELYPLRLLGTQTILGRSGFTHPLVEREKFLVSTGLSVEIPENYYGKIEDRSSLALKGVKTAGGVIDSSYRGELKVILYNHTSEKIQIQRGARIAQLLIHPVPSLHVIEVSELQESRRGEKGFGSTGI